MERKWELSFHNQNFSLGLAYWCNRLFYWFFVCAKSCSVSYWIKPFHCFFIIFLLVHKCQPKLCNQFNFGFLLVQIIVFLFSLVETIRFLFLIGGNNSIPVSYWWKQFDSCFLLVETIRFLFLIGSTFKFLFLTDANIRIKVHFCFCRCKI